LWVVYAERGQQRIRVSFVPALDFVHL
jgi:hypothetical protein